MISVIHRKALGRVFRVARACRLRKLELRCLVRLGEIIDGY